MNPNKGTVLKFHTPLFGCSYIKFHREERDLIIKKECEVPVSFQNLEPFFPEKLQEIVSQASLCHFIQILDLSFLYIKLTFQI